MKRIIFTIIFIISFIKPIYATELINDTIDIIGIEKYNNVIIDTTGNGNFVFSDVVKSIISGNFSEISISNIFNYILQNIFQEVFENSIIIKNVITIALICAILKVITESFKNKEVSEIGFYTSYIVIIILLIKSFNMCTDILYTTVDSIANMINSIMPLLVGVLALSGASASSTIFSGFILTALSFVSLFIKSLFIPFITSTAILNIINYITPKDILNKLIDFLKWIINFSLKTVALSLGFILSVQRIAAPALNSTINKTAKTFISFIPIVGDALSGAIDGIMHFVGLIKGGIGIGILIAIILCASVPVFKLISFILIYKITAVLIEPISDSRITACIDALGDYAKLLLSALIVFIVLFIFFIAIMLTVSG